MPAVKESLRGRIERFMLRPRFPGNVVEIAPDRCLAAAMVRRNGQIEIRSVASADVPDGALDPSFSQKNIADESSLRSAVQRALSESGISPGPITLLIPEASVKVTLHDDFDSLPSEPEHLRELVLHKLKKVLPFTTQEAALSWQAIRRAPKPLLLSVVIHHSILVQYEALLSGLGYQPGCVDIPTFNLLRAIEVADSTFEKSASSLLASVDRRSFSQALLVAGELAVFRTKSRAPIAEGVPSDVSVRLVVEEVLTTVRYYEDRLAQGQTVERVIVRDTNGHAHAIRDALRADLSGTVDVLDIDPLLAQGTTAPPPLTCQLIAPLIGAALR